MPLARVPRQFFVAPTNHRHGGGVCVLAMTVLVRIPPRALSLADAGPSKSSGETPTRRGA
jgi:hypothetical protein